MAGILRGVGGRQVAEITLQDVVTHQLDLVIECGFCSHKGLLDAVELVGLFGGRMIMQELPDQVRCRKCHRRGGHAVLFKTGDGKKDWWPRLPEARR
jgi:hypothetical protein